jgi:hypothetical protein
LLLKEATKPIFWEKYNTTLKGPLKKLITNLTPANAQYQVLSKKRNINGKYYGNLPIFKNATFAKNINNAGNLTNKQKNALRRMIRSIRVNNMEKNKTLVRYGGSREKLLNRFLENNPTNAVLLNRIKKNVANRRPVQNNSSNRGRSAPRPKIGGGNLGAPPNIFYNAQSVLNQHRRNYGN